MNRIVYLLPIFLILGISLLVAQDSVLVTDSRLDEISGIAASRINPGIYYVHNDSGGENAIYAINLKGRVVAKLVLEGIKNRDWEDIAVGPGDGNGTSYIFVGEIGDNLSVHNGYHIYSFPEPQLTDAGSEKTITVKSIRRKSFQYKDGKKDAETLLVDSREHQVFVVSKREQNVGLYVCGSSILGKNSPLKKAKRKANLDFPLAVGGDISPDGKHIIIKTYTNVFYWQRIPGQNVNTALKKQPQKLPYIVEPQGEAICFSADSKYYLTVSEKRNAKKVYLYIYPFNP